MKYLFLNHFAFENIDQSISNDNIVDLFVSLAYLLRDIRELDSELIFDNKLSQFHFNNKTIHFFLKLIDDKDIRSILIIKIQKPKPFCSDDFSEYFEDENIVLGNCVVDGTDIEILENFLACAMFLNSPILTPKSICTNSCFLNETISIRCDKESRELKNYFLENSQEILTDIEVYLESLDVEPLEYCLRKFKNSNLNFSLLEDTYGFNILNPLQQKEFLSTFNKFSQMSWNDIVKSAANRKGLKYKQYDGNWFENTQYSDMNIFKFRTSQKCRCFGYRDGDVFYVLRFEIDHSISDNG